MFNGGGCLGASVPVVCVVFPFFIEWRPGWGRREWKKEKEREKGRKKRVCVCERERVRAAEGVFFRGCQMKFIDPAHIGKLQCQKVE